MNNSNKKVRVCFVSPKAYPIFNPEIESVFGGAEVDLYMIATELAKDENFDVSFIVADYGQSEEEVREHVRILNSLNFKQNPLTSAWKIWKAMKQADADWYMLETASPGVPLGFLFSRFHRRKLLYRTASERECNGVYMKSHPVLGRFFVRCLKKVSSVITQNQRDHDSLNNLFDIDSQIIPNGHHIPDISGIDKDSVLWVGRSAAVKGAHRFVELATSLPNEKFVMICQRATGDMQYEDLKATTANVNNLEFIERVAFHEIDRYFERAKVFVNTSDSEGFPNTFIQACKASTAILSFGFNPDGFLDTHRCGAACDFNKAKMIETLRDMLDNRKYAILGHRGREYAQMHHDISQIAEQYKAIFKG